MMLLYSALLAAGLVASSPWWGFRMLTTRRYREGLRERLGRVPSRLRRAAANQRVVWFHAVSVGEVLAASRLIHDLQTVLNDGNTTNPWRVIVSTTTRTGQALARERFGADRVFWFPLDFAFAVRAWLAALRPVAVVLVESELWPRLLTECSRQGIPVAVANARISDRSFRRALRFRGLWSRVLRQVTLFLAQSRETADRLKDLGVSQAAIARPGNLKYDVAPQPTPMLDALRPLLERRSLVVAGSLLAPEERQLLHEWRNVCRERPEALLLLAPRHPERFAEVGRLVDGDLTLVHASDLLARYKSGNTPERLAPCAVVLLDTVGDLASVYSLGDLAFVGGSLVRRGGHNPLEPARFGVPVLMGPSSENFRDIVAALQAGHGIEIVKDAAELGHAIVRYLGDRVAADALGQRGARIFQEHSGATARSVEALTGLLDANAAQQGAVRGAQA